MNPLGAACLGRNVLGAQRTAENGRSALEHSRGKADSGARSLRDIACCRHKTFIRLVAGGS